MEDEKANHIELVGSLKSLNSRVITLNLNDFDFILSSLKSSYGNSESIKCLFELDENTQTPKIELTKCWCKILDKLIYARHKYEHVCLNMLSEMVTNYHKEHKCSSRTIVLFTLLIWKQLKSRQDELKDELDTKKMGKWLVIVLDMIFKLIERKKLQCLPKKSTEFVRILSRHFNKKEIASQLHEFSINEEFYKKIINGICRGQAKMTSLIWQLLLLHEKLFLKFNLEFIQIIATLSPSRSKCSCSLMSLDNGLKNFNLSEIDNQEFCYSINRGLTVQIDVVDYFIAKNKTKLGPTILNSLLIDSCLLSDFAHLGFNKNIEYLLYNDFKLNQERIDFKENWLKRVKSILNRVEILFVNGSVEKEISEFCKANTIILVKNMTRNQLEHIKKSFKSPLLIYIEDFDESFLFKCQLNIVDNVQSNQKLENHYLNLNPIESDTSISSCTFFSIILETKLEMTIQLYKELLKHFLTRLSNILNSGQYLGGNGDLEFFLANNLKNEIVYSFDSSELISSKEDDEQIYFDLIKEAYSDVFLELYKIIESNSQSKVLQISDVHCTIDDFKSKSEAWRTGCRICKIFLNTDKILKC
jgi:hypothetical protein